MHKTSYKLLFAEKSSAQCSSALGTNAHGSICKLVLKQNSKAVIAASRSQQYLPASITCMEEKRRQLRGTFSSRLNKRNCNVKQTLFPLPAQEGNGECEIDATGSPRFYPEDKKREDCKKMLKTAIQKRLQTRVR